MIPKELRHEFTKENVRISYMDRTGITHSSSTIYLCKLCGSRNTTPYIGICSAKDRRKIIRRKEDKENHEY